MMKNKISQLWNELVSFLKYSHPFLKITVFATPFLSALFLYSFCYLLPLASDTSILAGLTLIAEILGVLFGAMLVVIVFLIERLREAETHLTKAFPRYQQMVKEDTEDIFKAREQLIKFVLQKKFVLHNKFSDEESLTELKKCMTALSQLSKVLGDSIEEDQLEELGFSEFEINEVMGYLILLEETTPYQFFKLIRESFHENILIFALDFNLRFGDFWERYHMPMMQDDIFTALNRYESSHNILNGWLLSTTIVTNIMSLLISIFTTFSVTAITYRYPSTMLWIYVSLIGFLFTIFLLSASLYKMIVVGVEK